MASGWQPEEADGVWCALRGQNSHRRRSHDTAAAAGGTLFAPMQEQACIPETKTSEDEFGSRMLIDCSVLVLVCSAAAARRLHRSSESAGQVPLGGGVGTGEARSSSRPPLSSRPMQGGGGSSDRQSDRTCRGGMRERRDGKGAAASVNPKHTSHSHRA